MKTRSITILALILILVVAVSGCGGRGSGGGGEEDGGETPVIEEESGGSGEPAPASTPEPGRPPTRPETVNPVDIDALPIPLPGMPEVFDFADFTEDIFPRGAWTINQLADKYGTAEEAEGIYDSDYSVVWVDAEFDGLKVFFVPEKVDRFSFYSRTLKSGVHPLKAKDKGIRLEITALQVLSPAIELPYGIKINQSTKEDFLNIYPVKPYYEYQSEDPGSPFHMIGYQYAFMGGDLQEEGQPGSIDYYFNDSGALYRVDILWRASDL